MDTMKVGALNCQGLKEKYETPEFVDMVKSCLVFGVCETWLKKGENIVQVENYKFYPYSRKTEKGMNRGGGGGSLHKRRVQKMDQGIIRYIE